MDPYVLTALILALVGLVIVSIEMFVPSGGLLGILAAVCLLSSVYCVYQAWYLKGHYGLFITFVVSLLVLIPTVVGTTLYWLPRTRFGQHLFVMPQSLEELTPFVDEEQRLRALVHQRGKAITMFSPGGIALVKNEKHHAESEGVLIEAGDEVVVVGVKANRLVVRPASLYDAAAPVQEHSEHRPAGDQPRSDAIDFDFP